MFLEESSTSMSITLPIDLGLSDLLPSYEHRCISYSIDQINQSLKHNHKTLSVHRLGQARESLVQAFFVDHRSHSLDWPPKCSDSELFWAERSTI